jgi:hypothetical protein
MTNQILVLWQILEKMKEFRIYIHLPLIDFKSAHYNTDTGRMHEAMKELNSREINEISQNGNV